MKKLILISIVFGFSFAAKAQCADGAQYMAYIDNPTQLST
jgi:hypothetical protein